MVLNQTPPDRLAGRCRSSAALLGAVGCTVMLVLAACSNAEPKEKPVGPDAPQSPSSDPRPVQSLSPKVAGTVADGLNVPWSIAFMPNGDALVSQRDEATIVVVKRSGRVRTIGPVSGQQVASGSEAGLLGLAIDPQDPTSVFAYLSTAQDNRVVRMSYRNGRLADTRVIIEGIPLGPGIHQGGRLAFDNSGSLFVSTGDAGKPELAQDTGSMAGKILRVDTDGKPHPDNPFNNRVFSYGHRNVQGLAFDAQGRLWASEFGADASDELNRIKRGGNYGWPEVEGMSGDKDTEFVEPQAIWPTDDASPAGIAITRGTVFMGALRGERLWSIAIGSGTASQERDYLKRRYGRIRDVVVAPDGSLWISTSNTDGRGEVRDGDDRILRVRL